MFRRKTTKRKMFGRNLVAKLSLGAVFGALCVLPACTIHTTDNGKNGEKNVDIKSPVGDLHVSEQADIRDVGLPVYPGAKPAPQDDSDKENANVNLSVPGFTLKVAAAEFISDDSPEKIVAFYDKELQKYGKPIQCRGAWKKDEFNFSTSPSNASKPVWCDVSGSGESVELKVGTEGNQHVVAFKPRDHGSRFALVYVRVRTGKDDTI
jgi:hypothetical protein